MFMVMRTYLFPFASSGVSTLAITKGKCQPQFRMFGILGVPPCVYKIRPIRFTDNSPPEIYGVGPKKLAPGFRGLCVFLQAVIEG